MGCVWVSDGLTRRWWLLHAHLLGESCTPLVMKHAHLLGESCTPFGWIMHAFWVNHAHLLGGKLWTFTKIISFFLMKHARLFDEACTPPCWKLWTWTIIIIWFRSFWWSMHAILLKIMNMYNNNFVLFDEACTHIQWKLWSCTITISFLVAVLYGRSSNDFYIYQMLFIVVHCICTCCCL